MKQIRALLLLALFAAGARADSPGRDLADFQIGINCHQYYAENLPLLSDLGLKSGRIDVLWREVTDDKARLMPEAPTLRRINEAPLALSQTLAIFCYGHPIYQAMGRPTEPAAIEAFSRFCSEAAGVLRSRTRFFEIWNEWDVVGMGDAPVSEGKGTPEEYVQLLKSSYQAVKKASPDSVVLGGAMGGIGERDDYLPRALKAGLLDYCDGLSIHPYFYGAKTPEARLPENAIPERLNKVKAWLSDYPKGDVMPLYVTEIGWPTHKEAEGVSDDVQATYLARSILILALEPRVKGVWPYELRDAGSDPKVWFHHFGIVTKEGKPKAGYYALKDLNEVLGESRAIRELTDLSEIKAVRLLSSPSGEKSLIAWTVEEGRISEVRVLGLGDAQAKARKIGRFEFDAPKVLGDGDVVQLDNMPTLIRSESDEVRLEMLDRK